jgi:hypothetical protein
MPPPWRSLRRLRLGVAMAAAAAAAAATAPALPRRWCAPCSLHWLPCVLSTRAVATAPPTCPRPARAHALLPSPVGQHVVPNGYAIARHPYPAPRDCTCNRVHMHSASVQPHHPPCSSSALFHLTVLPCPSSGRALPSCLDPTSPDHTAPSCTSLNRSRLHTQVPSRGSARPCPRRAILLTPSRVMHLPTTCTPVTRAASQPRGGIPCEDSWPQQSPAVTCCVPQMLQLRLALDSADQQRRKGVKGRQDEQDAAQKLCRKDRMVQRLLEPARNEVCRSCAACRNDARGADDAGCNAGLTGQPVHKWWW